MFDRIMVPLDGSSASEIALPYAEEIASRLAKEIILVSVCEVAAAGADQLYRTYLKSIEERVLRELEHFECRESPKVRSEILIGSPAPEILRFADENDVSLITMASHGRSGGTPWLLGNVAAKVLRAAKKPVLLIKVAAEATTLLQRRLIRKVLLPLDGSKLGEQAVPYAEKLIQGVGAQTVLIQALEPLKEIKGEGYRGYPVLSETELRAVNERRKKFAEDYLEGMVKTFKEKGLPASCLVVRGSPAEQILDYAQKNGVDVIAMSTHGRSGMGRWVFGSVTDKILHAGDTAVLMVRASET